ncbi:MAG: vWA domain-containing protein, partial [Oscillospiraceae bacterium]|nr:vWA domain-containing protein [Oscillospiraceae bacterium]
MQKKAARRGQRALAFLLCLLMVATLLPVMGASAAEGGNAVGKDAPATVSKNPVLDKFLTEDASGNYTLTLTAYATGTTTTVTEKSGKPLDIVLVLDQSGSMYTSNYLQPLKTAVTAFVKSISDNAKEYNVDHRIALVGYASNNKDGESDSGTISSDSSEDSWINTGLFINGTLKNYGSSSKNTNTQLTAQDYKDALVPVNTDGRVTSSITTAISNIAASGATRTSYGMEMANKVFENNPIEGSDRQRIVVVFTDGQPGTSGYSKAEASAAVGKSYIAKNTYGATVYTVGLYS